MRSCLEKWIIEKCLLLCLWGVDVVGGDIFVLCGW